LNPNELLDELARRDVTLWTDGDDVRYRGPRGALTPELREALRESKAQVVAILRERARVMTTPPRPRLVAIPRSGPLPLSFGQQRLWFFDQLEPGSSVYNVSLGLRLRGPLDISALERSVSDLVTRHEALRTTFSTDGGQPVQIIHAPVTWTVPVVDVRDLVPAAREEEAARLASQEMERPFDLASGPLLRTRVLRLEDELHDLVVVAHHIAVDGSALNLLMLELVERYEAHAAGRPNTLPPLPIQYADFALWQRQYFSNGIPNDELAYWRRQLAGAPPALELPLDHPRPVTKRFDGDACERSLSPELRQRLHALTRGEGVTLFMTLLAAFNVVLARQTGQDDVCIGTPVAGRDQPETRALIGMFINTLVLRTRLDGRPTFRDVLRRVRKVALEAFAHQEVPFDMLVEDLHPERDPGRTPLFQVLFNMINFGASAPREFQGLRVQRALPSIEWRKAKFDLTLYVRDDPESLRFTAVYDVALFSATRVEGLLDQLVQLLEAVTTDPDCDVMAVSLVTPAAAGALPDPAQQLEATWIEPVHERFRRHAERAPERPAVVDASETLTYGDLERQSNQLAQYLMARGIGPEDRVAIYAQRSAGLAWAMLGVLKAGAAFVCLDPAYPPARTVACLDLVRPKAWIDLASGPVPASITDALSTIPGLVTTAWPARSSHDARTWRSCSTDAPVQDVGPDILAYVAFTSGSTGLPKGVAGTHAPLAHFFEWHARTSPLTADDRFSVLSGLAHDPLLRDILAALWVGAQVCIPDAANLGSPGYLARWMNQHAITVAHLTPAMAALLTTEVDTLPPVELPALRHVFFGADVLRAETVRAVRRLAPSATYVNFYGATETPQAIAWYPVGDGEAGAIPLGRGVSDVQLLVLNTAGRLCGIGELGEIHVRTPYLARGYVNDPVLTAERFLTNPFTGLPDDRIYRTGDLGRYRPDGTVDFCGRRDSQVKIRGFRVELGDVEAALRAQPGINEAAVVARADDAHELRLVGYVVPSETALQAEPLTTRLRDGLRQRLPAHMVPDQYVALERLPLTANGKVDRQALPAPTLERTRTPITPRTATETQIATIWSEVLGLESVGVEDNFFYLGGHSLMATRVLARLRSALGVELPLRALFETPTIAGLAEQLDHDSTHACRDISEAFDWNCLVPVQPRGTHPPLFLVVGYTNADETMLIPSRLIPHLGAEQPIYGLRPRYLDGSRNPYRDVHEMARECLEDIRTVQPRGPYFLGGYCIAGSVALEIAQLLAQHGEEVRLLAMIDAGRPCTLRTLLSRINHAVMRGRHMREVISTVMNSDGHTRKRILVQLIRRKMGVADSTLDATFEGAPTGRIAESRQRHVRLLHDYRPVPYPGHITVIASEQYYCFDRYMGWEKIARDGVTLHRLPGDHQTLLTLHSKQVAQLLRHRMDEGLPDAAHPEIVPEWTNREVLA
jgi:amino acid adenylation domain-containing protein